MRSSQALSDCAHQSFAHAYMGMSQWCRGELVGVREHIETAVSLYDSELHGELVQVYGHDSKAVALQVLHPTLCLLGYPDQGLAAAQESLRYTQTLGYAFTQATAMLWAVQTLTLQRRWKPLRMQSEEYVKFTVKHRLVSHRRWGQVALAMAFVGLGRLEEGVRQLREGIEDRRSAREVVMGPSHLGVLAEGLKAVGRLDEAVEVIAEALTLTEQTNERWSEPELHRLKGELLLGRGGTGDNDEHETCFLKSLDIARDQGARWWELRTSVSLARLWRDQGKRHEARNLLAPIYDWFTEGFDTADLTDAKALLEELY